MIRRQIATLFPGYELLGGGAFRIIRDSDIEIEEEAEDLVRFFRSAIKRRRRGRVIRLKLEDDMPDDLDALVREGLDASEALVFESTGFLGIADLAAAGRGGPARPQIPGLHAALPGADPRI